MANCWDQHKDSIYAFYIADGLKLDEVVQQMGERYGFYRNKNQYERQLKTWGIRKNVKQSEWSKVLQQKTKRKRDGKESDVSLGSVHVNAKRVKRALRRVPLSHAWNDASSSPKATPEPPQLTVSTPEMISYDPRQSWFGWLPWFQFREVHLSTPVCFKQASGANATGQRPLSILVAESPNSHSATLVLDRLKPTMDGSLQNSVPQLHDREHDATVQLLNNGNSSEAAFEVLKILFYQLSNKMQVSLELQDDLRDDAIIEVFNRVAQDNPHWVKSLLDSREPSVGALAENLFSVAIRQCHITLTSQLLTTVHIDPNTPILGRPRDISFSFERGRSRIDLRFTSHAYSCTPLEMAVSMANVDLACILIRAGAEVNPGKNYEGLSPLELACSLPAYDEAVALVKLLIKRGALINRPISPHRPTALMLAVAACNVQLVQFLVDQHVDVTRRYSLSSLTCKYLDVVRVAVLSDNIKLFEVLMQWSQCRSQLQQDPDLLVLAISLRSFRLINYLKDAGISPNRESSWGEHPMTTAMFVEDQRITDFLLGWGASVSGSPSESPWHCVRPSPSHAAAFMGNTRQLGWLMHRGVAIDQRMTCRSRADKDMVAEIYACYSDIDHHYLHRLTTPLQLSLDAGHIEAALLILRSGWRRMHGGELVFAARLGSLELIDSLMRKGVSMKDKWLHETALQSSITHGHLQIVPELIRRGATVVGGEYARALMNGDQELISLVKAKADSKEFMKAGSHGVTPLEAAYATNNLQDAHLILLQAWASYDSAVLCSAVWNAVKHKEVVAFDALQLLLVYRPDLETDGFEATAMCLAAAYEYHTVLNLLFSHLKPSLAVSIDIAAVKNKSRFWWRDKNLSRKSILEVIVGYRSPSIVEMFISRGFLPDEDCFLQVLKLSLAGSLAGNNQKISDLIWDARHPSTYNPTCHGIAFEIAIKAKELQLVWKLLDAGLSVDSRRDSRSGWTPLQMGCQLAGIDMVEALLVAGADVNAPPAPQGGATALQVAAIMNNMAFVRILIEKGADVNAMGAQGANGRTALEGAAEYGRLDMVQLLLEKGVETEGSGRKQFIRAIRLAEREGHISVAKLLKTHRNWTEEDQVLMQMDNLCEYEDHSSY